MGGGAWAYEEQSGMSWDSLVNLRGRGALSKWGGGRLLSFCVAMGGDSLRY